ncbi:MAG: MinD/ParA family protein [Verrucomicrobiaceae bacterium]|nr:MAG: MinD/ParA family protein [Verrucomicrobiaceae bacterium]
MGIHIMTTRHLNPLYAIASGKGGVGKTSLTLNLSAALSQAGKRVLLLDGDTGLANLDVQLNVQPQKDLAHVLAGTATLSDIALPIPQLSGKGSVTLLPGRAGHAGLTNVTQPQLLTLLTDLRTLSASYDITLIDVAAGIAPAQLLMCAQSDATLLVTTPDPSSLTDAYALIKLLWQQHGTSNTRLVANQASKTEAAQLHTRLTTAAEKFLQLPPLPMLAQIPSDRLYSTAVKSQQIATLTYPQSTAVESISQLARSLLQ